MAESYLSDMKILLGLADNDVTQDALLSRIIDNTQASLRVKLHLASDQPTPRELDYVITEVGVKRFNRLNNEGMTNYTQEGESIAFNASDFAEFQDDIDSWLADNQKSRSTFGRVAFINPYGGGSNRDGGGPSAL